MILGRPGCAPPDSFPEVLLHDLVEPGAWLDLKLKRLFLLLWVNNGDFGNTNNSKDPIIALDQANVRKFAAMVPVVDLEFLRGIRVNHIYEN